MLRFNKISFARNRFHWKSSHVSAQGFHNPDVAVRCLLFWFIYDVSTGLAIESPEMLLSKYRNIFHPGLTDSLPG